MRINPKQYGILLYELTKDADDRAINEVVGQFLRLLIKNRNLSLLPKIKLMYQNYYNEQEGETDVTITALDNAPKSAIEKIKKQVGAKNINVETKIDKNILGGSIIRFGDYLVDNTLRTKLNLLSRSLS